MQHNYKIACLGCSFTEGQQIDNGLPIVAEHYRTWPHVLQNWLNKKHNIKSTIYNAGRAGASVMHNHLSANFLLKEFDPDIFIVQITTYDRTMMFLDPINENENDLYRFGYDMHGTADNYYFKVWDNSKSWIHLSPGLGWAASKHNPSEEFDWLLEKIYKDDIDQKVTPPISFEQFKSYIALWHEQSDANEAYRHFYYTHVYSLIDFLKAKGKIVIPFYWLKFRPKFKSHLFGERQYPCMEASMGADFLKEYSIDKGFHLDQKGHVKMINEFLGQQVLETMK